LFLSIVGVIIIGSILLGFHQLEVYIIYHILQVKHITAIIDVLGIHIITILVLIGIIRFSAQFLTIVAEDWSLTR
jgi:hypothetical protein